MRNRNRTGCFCLVALAALMGPTFTESVRAQVIDESKALKVKAAYLYNFSKFIEWPDNTFADEKAPFVIGILGDGPFGQTLGRTVRDKQMAGRPIKIQRFNWLDKGDREALKKCQVLFVSATERTRLAGVLAVLDSYPVLVVSDAKRFAYHGGMIGFVLESGRIVFEINRQALERAGLRASSKLLKLARIVEPQPRGTSGP